MDYALFTYLRPCVCFFFLSKKEDKYKRGFVRMAKMEFMECAVCVAKTGSPTLCASCLHNRAVIEKLNSRLEQVGIALDNVLDQLDS